MSSDDFGTNSRSLDATTQLRTPMPLYRAALKTSKSGSDSAAAAAAAPLSPDIDKMKRARHSAEVKDSQKKVEDEFNPTSERPPGLDRPKPPVEEGLDDEEIDHIRKSGAVGNDEDFLWDILETTKNSVRDKLKSIELAVIACEWRVASRHCHTIKGSTSMLDMKKLWAASLASEQALKQVDVSATKLDDASVKALDELRYQVQRLENTKMKDA